MGSKNQTPSGGKTLSGGKTSMGDANFSIKCGGNEMRSSKGVVFEADNSTLGPASYFVDNTQKWAGNRQLQDFDIRKEVGGSTNRALQKNFKAQVSENYLIIHLFWAGKGTCCIPVAGSYGPSISAISVVSDFQPTGNGLPPTTASRKKNKTGLIVGILVSVGVGILHDGRVVAVKQLSVASQQGKRHFVAEIATISAVQHRNLVKLYGFCIKGDKKLLVYEYLENKSLDQALFGKSGLLLDWQTCYNICFETARVLAGYLAPEYAMRIHSNSPSCALGIWCRCYVDPLVEVPHSDSSFDADKIFFVNGAWNIYMKLPPFCNWWAPQYNQIDKSESYSGDGVSFFVPSRNRRRCAHRCQTPVAMLAENIEVNTVLHQGLVP
ncbi:hypothetical protein HHK36_004729 [Tetracentron sinense]|uniref:non-specific serine/threonine protein kinase n=1 Tax=Tetracentron sinense TaxID=13715 RepID=A0A834ZSL1_TETSI|nr:hypothetical protein HHK36_004729 [Tetracentron sinense]